MIFLLAALFTSVAHADPALIQELKSLRNELPLQDASRPRLTLRLADVLFDERKVSPDYASEAIALYQEALSGKDGLFPKPAGTSKLKIQFQLARLWAEANQDQKANPLWLELVQQNDVVEIKREAALRLAEVYEADAKTYAEASKYYELALQLCAGGDLCSYAHYRRAWLFKKSNQGSIAIAEMQKALWDSKGQIREESLRDLIVFLSEQPDANFTQDLTMIEDLSARLTRPGLITDLAEAYYSAGNKKAGTYVLEYVNSKSPSIDYQIRLMEENYGARNWDRFRRLTQQAASREASEIQSAESEKILRRLTIQLDGERTSQPQFTEDFKMAALLYLKLFPNTPSRKAMMEGWVAAETDPSVKLSKLDEWTKRDLSREDEISLRELRTAIAQKSKNIEVVRQEAKVLAGLVQSPEKKREYRYLQAKAAHDMKDFDAALPVFQDLAREAADKGAADQIAMDSQNLALDILGARKDYDGLLAQTALWLRQASLKKDAKLASDMKDFERMSQQAEFEKAASLGQTSQALKAFSRFCQEGRFRPKSCENARVLAVQLKDYQALFDVLKIEGRKDELAMELEARGFFEQSALMQEPGAGKDLTSFLKVALLFDLAQKQPARDRVLLTAIQSQAFAKASEKERALCLEMVKDAGLLNPALLRKGLTKEEKYSVAEMLESSGRGNADTRTLLLDSKKYLGPAWAKAVVSEIRNRSEAQKRISFYGRNSKANFEKRVKVLKALAEYAEPYLQGADGATRLEILTDLAAAHQGFAEEILNSPIPEGVPNEAIPELKASLQQLGEPFAAKARAFEELKAQVAVAPASSQPAPAAASVSAVQKDGVFLEKLHTDPQDSEALASLRDFHQARGQYRLAAYFEGRLKK